MKVNIVMLTKNRAKLTSQSLKTLRTNTPEHLYNLTVVDDGGGFPLPAVWNGNAIYLHVRAQDTKGITAMARNLGVYWAEQYWGRSDLLYLSDNDIYFPPGWLEKMIAAYQYGFPYGLSLLAGWNHPYHLTNFHAPIPGMDPYQIHTNHAVAGSSQLMKWEVWDEYGPLKHGAPGVCQGEDVEFCQAITKNHLHVGKIYPHVVFNVGVTNSHGNPAPGAEQMVKELEEVRKNYPDIVWE